MFLLVAAKGLVWSQALIFMCADIFIYTTFIHSFFHLVRIRHTALGTTDTAETKGETHILLSIQLLN